jgi:hypothetical protein
MTFSAWIRQPSTVIGIGAGLSTVAGIAVGYFYGPDTGIGAAGVVMTGVCLLINDGTGSLKADVQQTVKDALADVATKNLAALPALAEDVAHVVKDVEVASAPTPAGNNNGGAPNSTIATK